MIFERGNPDINLMRCCIGKAVSTNIEYCTSTSVTML